MDSRRIILRSLFTEKSTRQQERSNQFVFAVDPSANKRQIADAMRSA